MQARVPLFAACILCAALCHARDLAQSRGTLDSADECVRKLDPQVDIGYARIAAQCPQLARELEQSEWAAWWPRGWKDADNDLSAGSLKELGEVVAREKAAATTGRIPDLQRLHAILAQNRGAQGGSASLWSRFKSWLRSVFQKPEQPETGGWLSHLIARAGFSQSVLELIVYGALTVIVLLAGVIVLNELRAAGLIAKKGAAASAAGQSQVSRQAAALGWQDIEHAAAQERPRLLLELLAAQLIGAPFIPPSRALTLRELARSGKVPEADDRELLTELASVAERLRFSGDEPPKDTLQAAVRRGKELLDRLGNATATVAVGA